MICPNCNRENIESFAFCPTCGTALPAEASGDTPSFEPTTTPAQDLSSQTTIFAPPEKGLAIAGMVLGIISLVLSFTWLLALPCAIVGLIFSIKAKKAIPLNSPGRGMATAGFVCSIIGLVLSAFVAVACIIEMALFSLIPFKDFPLEFYSEFIV